MNHPRKQDSSSKKYKLSTSIIKIQYGMLRPPNIESIPTEVQLVIEDAVGTKYRPEELIVRIEELIARYPKIAVLRNTHYTQLSLLGRTEESLTEAEWCFKNHKNYVFGRLAYAHLLVEAGYYEKMEEVMEYFTTTLPIWYPKRTEFQYKEVALYVYFHALYHCRKGDIENVDKMVSLLIKMTQEEDENILELFLKNIAAMKLKFAQQPMLSSQRDTMNE